MFLGALTRLEKLVSFLNKLDKLLLPQKTGKCSSATLLKE